MTEYDVKREHYGDKFYRTGEQREANPNDVKHLVAKGVLAEASEVVVVWLSVVVVSSVAAEEPHPAKVPTSNAPVSIMIANFFIVFLQFNSHVFYLSHRQYTL